MYRAKYFIIMILFSLPSCSNIYHDLQSQKIDPLMIPPTVTPQTPASIVYTVPSYGSTGMETNKAILIFFDKELSPSGFSDQTFFLTIANGGEPVALTASLTGNNRAIKITPAALSPSTIYTLAIVGNIIDSEGIAYLAGYTLLFGTSLLSDTKKPSVASSSPVNDSNVGYKQVQIWAVFDEEMNPDPVALQSCFTVKDSGGQIVPGSASFQITALPDNTRQWKAIFTPSQGFQFEKNAVYIAEIKCGAECVRDLAGNDLPHYSWSFFTFDAQKIESASNITNGFGTFGSTGYNLKDDAGNYLADLYPAGTNLTGIFDFETTGDLGLNKYLRIVSNGTNILNLGITSVATTDALLLDKGPPQGKTCLVNLQQGSFVLPRPIYWSTMESEASITSPRICMVDYPPVYVPDEFNLFMLDGMFGGFSLTERTHDVGSYNVFSYLYPFGNPGITSLASGTLSIWVKIFPPIGEGSEFDSTITINLGGNTNINCSDTVMYQVRITLNMDGVEAAYKDVEWKFDWHHIYAVWDHGNGLSGGRSLIVYLDGIESLTNAGHDFVPGSINVLRSVTRFGLLGIDNLKIWNHVVTEDPSFEWNGGAGREDALHQVYGPSNEYRPGPEISVGYFYQP